MAHPTLASLFEELADLNRAGHLKPGGKPKPTGSFALVRGRDTGRLSWPGVGDYYLTKSQCDAVAVLLDAYLRCATPDVGERYILTSIGSKAKRLADVFAGSTAWGTLVVPGRGAGAYRLAEVRQPEPEPQEVREVVEGDD